MTITVMTITITGRKYTKYLPIYISFDCKFTFSFSIYAPTWRCIIQTMLSVSHARGVDSLYLLLLVAAKLVDGGEGNADPTLPDGHPEVLVALH